MDVSTIPAVPGARKRKKRLGRGIGSGHGKTATRGQKGQRSRTGSRRRPGFEGGRNPLIRRLPKRGFRYKATGRPVRPAIVNVGQLNRCQEGERLTPERLWALGLISNPRRPVKLLGDGTLTKRVTLVVHQASESAKAKVAQAGGSVEVLSSDVHTLRPHAQPEAPGSGLRAHGDSPQPPAQGPQS